MKLEHRFEDCLSHWTALLDRHIGGVGSLRWAFRENLSAGDGEGDPSVSLHFQCIAPALSSSDAGRVFERERTAGRDLHFELVAAQPEAVVVSLRREPTWARYVDPGFGVTMQVEPSFQSFVELDDLEEWRRLTAGHARNGRLAVLDGVLSAREAVIGE